MQRPSLIARGRFKTDGLNEGLTVRIPVSEIARDFRGLTRPWPQELEKASARGLELEASAAARLNQFRSLPAKRGLPDVDDGRVTRTPTNAGVVNSPPVQSGGSRSRAA
jgi:hypothetical protein